MHCRDFVLVKSLLKVPAPGELLPDSWADLGNLKFLIHKHMQKIQKLVSFIYCMGGTGLITAFDKYWKTNEQNLKNDSRWQKLNEVLVIFYPLVQQNKTSKI